MDSRNLFTRYDGTPMCFSLIPCAERKEIREMIEDGGGMLVQPGINSEAIKLVPAGSKAALDAPVFSTEFVRECSKRMLLLPLKNFTVEAERSSPDDVEDVVEEPGTASATCQSGALQSTRVRKDFSLGEDINIAKFIAKEPGRIRGNEIYKRLERSRIAGQHTWQSLRERYLKKIYPMRHLFESPTCVDPRRSSANAQVLCCSPPVSSHGGNLESSFLGPRDVPGTSGSTVATPRATIDANEQILPTMSTCDSLVVPETDYDSLCHASSSPGDNTLPFVPSVSRSTDNPCGKPRACQGAVYDGNTTQPFVPHLEGDLSAGSPPQPLDAPACNAYGDTEPFVVDGSEGQAEEVALQGSASDDESSITSTFTPLDAIPSPPSKKGPLSQKDSRWPSLSDVCYSPGDFQMLQRNLVGKSSQSAQGTLEDVHLASFPDFPSNSQSSQLIAEPDTTSPDARVFAEKSAYSLSRASQRDSDRARTGVVSGQRKPSCSSKDGDEPESSLRKASECGVTLTPSSDVTSSGEVAGSSDKYATATDRSASPRAATDLLLDALIRGSCANPELKIKMVHPIILAKPQERSQCSQQVQASQKDCSPSLLDNRDCEMEVEAVLSSANSDVTVTSDMSLTLEGHAGEIWCQSYNVGGQLRSPCQSVCQGALPPEAAHEQEDSEIECEQPGPSRKAPPSEDYDSDSCDTVIVREQKTGKSRARLILSSSDEDEAAAPTQPKRLNKKTLLQHQRNLQQLLDTKEQIEKRWCKQRPHKKCAPYCSCQQSPYYTTLRRLLIRTRAILAFHDALDVDPEMCASAILSELVERRRSEERIGAPALASTSLRTEKPSPRRRKK